MKQAQQLLNLLERQNPIPEIKQAVDDVVETQLQKVFRIPGGTPAETLTKQVQQSAKSLVKRLFGEDFFIKAVIKGTQKSNGSGRITIGFTPEKQNMAFALEISLPVPLIELAAKGSQAGQQNFSRMVKDLLAHEFTHADQMISRLKDRFGDDFDPSNLPPDGREKIEKEFSKGSGTKVTPENSTFAQYLSLPEEIDAFAAETAQSIANFFQNLNEPKKIKGIKLANLDDIISNLGNEFILKQFLNTLSGADNQLSEALSLYISEFADSEDPNDQQVWQEFLKKLGKFLIEIQEEGKIDQKPQHVKPPKGVDFKVA